MIGSHPIAATPIAGPNTPTGGGVVNWLIGERSLNLFSTDDSCNAFGTDNSANEFALDDSRNSIELTV